MTKTTLGAMLPPVVSHEALHAQFFLNEGVRQAVDSYWDGTLT